MYILHLYILVSKVFFLPIFCSFLLIDFCNFEEIVSMESYDIGLPSEILFEILSRAPLETMASSRLLSKECNSLTYESRFMHLHSLRTKTISGYFVQSLIKNQFYSDFVSMNNTHSKLSLKFLPGPVQILASTSQGILLCVNKNPRNHRIPEYYVCKPTTQQFQVIPNPKTRYPTEATAMIVVRSKPLQYKIVRCSLPKPRNLNNKLGHSYNLRCEIFNSDDWAWKNLDEVNFSIGELLCKRVAIMACGALHWLTNQNRLFAFNGDGESWSIFSLPDPFMDSNYCDYKQLVEYEGKLAMICTGSDGSSIELWVMESYERKIWNKRETISIEALQKKEPYACPKSLYNRDVTLMEGYHRMYFYEIKKGNYNMVKLDINPQQIFPFRSDVELADLKGGEKYERSRNRPNRRTRRSSESEAISDLGSSRGISYSPTFNCVALLVFFILFCSIFDI